MKPNNNDGSSSGADENNHDGFRVKLDPFLKTQESLPQQIDPNALYVGLPTGWVEMFECAADLEGVPENHYMMIKSGGELLKMLK